MLPNRLSEAIGDDYRQTVHIFETLADVQNALLSYVASSIF